MTAELFKAFWLFLPLAFLAGIAYAYRERRRLVRRTQEILVFRPIGAIRLLYWWSVALSLALICGPSLYLDRLEPWSISAGSLIAVFALITWPPSLLLDSNCLKSQRWWGASTEIDWCDVNALQYDCHSFRTIVISKDGKRIEHTLIDCDPDRFQLEVITRAGHCLAIV